MVGMERISFHSYAITGEVIPRDNNCWWITTVYGPQSCEDKVNFLRELTERRSLCPGPWLLLGNFNMILDQLDRNMMSWFRHFVHEHELKHLYLHGHLFTWSNEREAPTLTRINRTLISVD
jgi:hypothetical protein